MSEAGRAPGWSARLLRWLGAHTMQLVGIVLVLGVFGFVLPRVADYGAVWDVVSGLSGRDLVLLAAAAILNLLTFAPPWMAALPGLTFRNAFLLSQASTAAANVLPGGDAVGIGLSFSMLRRWGFAASQITVATGATAIWNILANVSFAVIAVVLLAAGGESNALLTTAAVVGAVALVFLVAGAVVAVRNERNVRRAGVSAARLANRVRSLMGRVPVSGWDEALARLRGDALALVGRRWISLTLATLTGHLTVLLVLLVSVRVVGVSSAAISISEVFAAWALIRILTTIPITPGGVGVVELGLTGALVSFGGDHARVVAAVLLYRVLTFVPPIAVGGVCLLIWRRLGRAVTAG